MAPKFEYINTHTNYGLNTFGCNSSVLMKDGNVYTFKYFGITGSPNENNMYYHQLDDNGNEITDGGEWFTPSKFKLQVVSEVKVINTIK